MTGRPAMPMWTVYQNPKDYPGQFVARRFVIIGMGHVAPTDDVVVGQTLDQVRTLLPPGLYRLERMPGDDAKIVEVWL